MEKLKKCLKNETTLSTDNIWDIQNLPQDLQDVVQCVKLCEAHPKQNKEVLTLN